MIELEAAISHIHLSFDIWTSPNGYSIISIFSHYINASGQRRRRLLAFRRIFGAHTGDNIAQALLKVIREYSIEAKVRYFMSDNAANNDVAVAAVLKELFPNLTAKQSKARRLRCFSHITNLCARALLLGKGAGKALSELERKAAKGHIDAVDQFWKGKGALGRLHNIVVYIRCTPQRLEEFAKCQSKDLNAHLNRLKVSFEIEVLDVRVRLSANMQGYQRALYEYYPSLAWMMNTIDAFRTEFATEAANDSTFQVLLECCQHSWNKTEKYYVKCDETPVVYAAVMLNPAKKHQWFKEEWQNGTQEQRMWIEAVKVQVEELWRTEYRQTIPIEPSIAASIDDESLHAHLHQYKRLKRITPAAAVDDFADYIETDALDEGDKYDPLPYWYQRRQQQPDLARFAFDCLAIPPMSDDAERSFSGARDMISYRRSNLQDDIIEASSCLRNWYGHPSDDSEGKEPFDEDQVIEEQYQAVAAQDKELVLWDEDNQLHHEIRQPVNILPD